MNIKQRVILNSSFGENTRHTDHKRIHGLTVSELDLVRLLFKTNKMSFEDAMNALRDHYNFYKRVLNENN